MSPLPRTTYVWLGALTASILIGERLPVRSPESATTAPAATKEALSGPDFERYLDAERAIRLHYGTPVTSAPSLTEPAAIYAQLATTLPVPNLPRRALILNAQLKKPLDSKLLNLLATALRAGKVPETEVQTELALWRALYGKNKDAPLPADAEQRLKAMHLRFLENQAFADLARVREDRTAQRAAEARRDAQAKRYVGIILPLVLVLFLSGFLGVGLLALLGIAAFRRQWQWLGKVEHEPHSQRLDWTALVDAFIFYLALYRGLGVGLALGVRLLDLHPPVLPVQALLQGGTGLVAILYLATKAKQSGASLRQIGCTTKLLGTNVLYGVLGYAATLPLTLGLGKLSQLIFQDNVNTTPNPVLPLLAAGGAFWERGLIFLMAAVFAPLFEEFFFRGALLTGLQQRFGSAWGIVFSSIAFAVVHPPQDWLPIFGLGVSFALLRHLRQSLVPGMVAHFLQNSLAYLMLTSLFTS